MIQLHSYSYLIQVQIYYGIILVQDYLGMIQVLRYAGDLHGNNLALKESQLTLSHKVLLHATILTWTAMIEPRIINIRKWLQLYLNLHSGVCSPNALIDVATL